MLAGELLLVSAAVKEEQAIVCSIEIRTKGNGLVQLADRILVFLLILVEDGEFEMSLVQGRCDGNRSLQQRFDGGQIRSGFTFSAAPQAHSVVVNRRSVAGMELYEPLQAFAYFGDSLR